VQIKQLKQIFVHSFPGGISRVALKQLYVQRWKVEYK